MKLDRKLIVQQIQAISDKNKGRITPEQVVNAARDPDSPIHHYFNWDDKSAGDAYRLDQARTLIRSVKIKITTHRTKVTTVAYVQDPTKESDQQGYLDVVKIKKDVDIKRSVLIDEFSRVASILKRAKAIAIAFNMEDEIEDFIKTVEGFRTHLGTADLVQ